MYTYMVSSCVVVGSVDFRFGTMRYEWCTCMLVWDYDWSNRWLICDTGSVSHSGLFRFSFSQTRPILTFSEADSPVSEQKIESSCLLVKCKIRAKFAHDQELLFLFKIELVSFEEIRSWIGTAVWTANTVNTAYKWMPRYVHCVIISMEYHWVSL